MAYKVYVPYNEYMNMGISAYVPHNEYMNMGIQLCI